MQTKSFITVLLCVVLLVTLSYGAYQAGYSIGKADEDKNIASQKILRGNDTDFAYAQGFQDGLKAELKSTYKGIG